MQALGVLGSAQTAAVNGSFQRVSNRISTLVDGANAVVGVDLDYVELGAHSTMVMLVASGTAVVIEENVDEDSYLELHEWDGPL